MYKIDDVLGRVLIDDINIGDLLLEVCVNKRVRFISVVRCFN